VTVAIRPSSDTFTPRQQAVLTAALDLLVEAGDGLTMTAVARRASCSKETLYKWFGDRDGLLTATVQWQAAKVRVPLVDRKTLDPASLRASIFQFARDLLSTIAGETSVALNRLAIGHASAHDSHRDGSKLGKLLLERGRRQIDRRAMALIDAGKRAGLLRFHDADEAYHTLYGLIVSDLHVRMLLGEPGLKDTARQAEKAVTAFLRLYGTEKVLAEMPILG